MTTADGITAVSPAMLVVTMFGPKRASSVTEIQITVIASEVHASRTATCDQRFLPPTCGDSCVTVAIAYLLFELALPCSRLTGRL
jgi:hypothetical protein